MLYDILLFHANTGFAFNEYCIRVINVLEVNNLPDRQSGGAWESSNFAIRCISVQCIYNDVFSEQIQHHLLDNDIHDWSNAALYVMEQLD